MHDDDTPGFVPSCPIPTSEYPHIVMAHGGGGRVMQTLIDKLFVASFDNAALGARHDGAVLDAGGTRIAFTTDTYVVRPLFFPGGDIGSLAVHGTVNDLAMCGARPLALSAALVLEEGFPIDTLWRIVRSMRAAARAAGVDIVTGDTKVVEHGKGDGVYINTAGVGVVEAARAIAPSRVAAGDCIVVSGDIGRHGIAIMAAREGLELEHTITSDSAALCRVVGDVLATGADVHCMRDLTRGGLGAALCEIAEAGGVHVEVDEGAVQVRDDVRGACELLGLDPMFVANEGRFVAFVPEGDAERVLASMRAHNEAADALVVGRVVDGSPGLVTVRTAIGTSSILDTPSGEQLPRIC